MTVFCQVDRIFKDVNEYTTYVFELLDPQEMELLKFKYVTCTKMPNWEDAPVSLGEIGYLDYREIHEGVDKWYNKEEEKMVPYKYTFSQYIKFIPKNTSSYECQL